ncbi:MAG TPA: cyclic nucleotide-binding domain-containing protein [Casimicrobiaceae bacterium]|nr:cyclic nucleotide-binding domain-containing protein [Casimicrobiaceae bacterium]
MSLATTIAATALVGLFTTSAVMIGTTLGLYGNLSKKMLAVMLAFAAGMLISSLGLELAYEGARELHNRGLAKELAWAFISGGFATGAIIYYIASRFLDRHGAAVRSPTRFREYVLERQQEHVQLLGKCDLLRHLPAEGIQDLLTYVRPRQLGAGEILFRAGDPGDALYIVARGRVAVLQAPQGATSGEREIAQLGEGKAFGEMALLSGAPRSATVRAVTDAELLQIDKDDFEQLLATDHQLAAGLRRLSHERAINNLTASGSDRALWTKIATSSLDHPGRRQADEILSKAGHGAGLAIILGDLLDTIPGLVVVGAKFTSLATLSVPVMLGIFLGGIPESAASAALLRKAGFRPRSIYAFWSITLIAGTLSAVAGKVFIGSSDSLLAVFAEAMAGGSLLALVSHAMIPEALDQGGSLVVLPTVAGFLAALYLILSHSLV